jgi:hypothetical protein
LQTKSTLFISVFVILVATSIFGCSKTTSTTPALAVTEIIIRSSEKMQAVNSFHFALDQEGGSTPIAFGISMKKASGDVIRPDKLKMTISGTVVGLSLEVQIVRVGEDIYMTNPLSGKWEIPPAEFQVLRVLDPNAFIANVMKLAVNPARLNDEEAEGTLCYHLSGTIDSGDLSAITGNSAEGVAIKTEIWIGINDFLVHKVQLEGKITENEVEGIVRLLRLSNFDKEISIELPE